MSGTIFNSQLVAIAKDRVKRGFVDPATASGAGGGDPAAAGGMPPGGGGMPPMGGSDPAAAGGSGGGGLTVETVQQMIQAAVQGGGMGGGMGGAGGGAMGPNGMPKKKVDVNTEMYQIKKMLAMIMDAQGIPVPATITLGDPVDDPHMPPGEAAKDPHSAASQSSIMPPSPIQGASPGAAAAGGGMGGGMGGGGAAGAGGGAKTAGYAGEAYDGRIMLQTANRAGALARLLKEARSRQAA